MQIEKLIVFFVEANSEKHARNTIKKIKKNIDFEECSFEVYHKGGFKVSGKFPVDASDWKMVVFNTIQFAQEIGWGWYLSADVNHHVSLWCNNAKFDSITDINIEIWQLR